MKLGFLPHFGYWGELKVMVNLGFKKHVNKIMPVKERRKHFTFTLSVAT